MSKPITGYAVMAILEDRCCAELVTRLANLEREKALREEELRDLGRSLKQMGKRRLAAGTDVSAAVLEAMEAERQADLARKRCLEEELANINEQLSILRMRVLGSMRRTRFFHQMGEKQQQEQRKQAERLDQRFLDDLIAHRVMRGSGRL